MPLRRASAQPRIAVAIALAIAFTACHRGAHVPDGDVAATLTLPSLGEHAFDPDSLHGAPSIVLFVTPTCPHCLAELPVAARAATAAGAKIVAVFIAGKKENAVGVIATTKFPGPVLIDDGTLRTRFDIKRVPYAVVLGGDGHAHAAFTGEQAEDTFRDALADAR